MPTIAKRIALALWAVATLLLGLQVVNLTSLTDDWRFAMADDERDIANLHALLNDWGRGRSKDSVAADLRRLKPGFPIDHNDSTLILEELTFRFDSAGELDSLILGYEPD